MLGLAVGLLLIGLLIYLISRVEKQELESLLDKGDKATLTRLVADMPIEDEAERSAILTLIRDDSTIHQLRELIAA